MDPDVAEVGVTLGDRAPREPWDAIVIGAGPAGALSACLLAREGLRVLLVERKRFPRPKVCGGCLNAQALAALERAGLADRVRALGASRVHTFRLHQHARTAVLRLPPGLAVSRRALDAALAAAAVEAGCVLLTETAALVVPEGGEPWREGWRRVSLQQRHGQSVMASARAIIAADGLAHSSLRECASFHSRVSPAARVGIGGEAGPGAIALEPASITMAVGRHGYVGAVEVEGGRVNIAAAVDPAFLKARATASCAIRAILAEAGVRAGASLDGVDWTGTISLTRRLPRPAARGVFVVGDAAGYVEPFTGEGMAWAFAGAEAVVPFVKRAMVSHDPGLENAWARAHARGIGHEQRWCRIAARVLRRPALVTSMVMLLRRQPGLARPVLAHLAPRPAPDHGRTG
jgi:flavin-dependent dehydrogenase